MDKFNKERSNIVSTCLETHDDCFQHPTSLGVRFMLQSWFLASVASADSSPIIDNILLSILFSLPKVTIKARIQQQPPLYPSFLNTLFDFPI